MTELKIKLVKCILYCDSQERLEKISEVVGIKKKEIVIDKLGKWKMRNGEIVEIKDLNREPCEEYPSHIIYGGGYNLVPTDMSWHANGKYLSIDGEHHWDLVEFISPPEFTEEGLYEMANGETIEVHKIKLPDNPYVFYNNDNPVNYRKWDKFGVRFYCADEPETNLIRYLGKKPFEIDKPGVYECRDGGIAAIGKKHGEYWHGHRLTKNDNGYWYDWYSNGFANLRSKSSVDIIKFISPTWNFEKGEPV